jgi:hypothetical protein
LSQHISGHVSGQVSRRGSRLVAAGATVALAVGTVLVAAPAAEAKTFSLKSSFVCSTDFGDQTFPVTTKIKLPAKVKKGTSIPGKTVKMQVVIPAALAGLMSSVGIESLSGSASGVKAKIGSTKVPVKNVAFPDTKVPSSGDMKINAKGKASSVKLKKPGVYTVSIPKKFKFTAVNQDGDPLLTKSPCSLAPGEKSKLGTLKVTK